MERCFPNSDVTRMRVPASWKRGRSTSTPNARKDKKVLTDPEGIPHGFRCKPRRPLQAAGVGARLDERISSASTH